MRVQVKLMASLRSKLPSGGKAALELEPGTTVAVALSRLEIPPSTVHLVMINGSAEPDSNRTLAEGDEVVVFPPVAGG